MAGESNNLKGKIVQYSLSTGKMLKDYGLLGIESVKTGIKTGKYSFFGGSDSHLLCIDFDKRQVIKEPQRTEIESISCIDYFLIHQKDKIKKHVIAIVGKVPWKSTIYNDVYDITNIISNK